MSDPNYWTQHGVWLLVGLAVFPRLTLLFSSIAFGGVFWWLGFFLAPHILIAVLAIPYAEQNPVLVALAWVWGLLGTFGESKTWLIDHYQEES